MSHLLKKISLAGGKGKKPKAKPATLSPPKVGELQMAASYSYAEILDLISDGPIEGLVNKNGLVLSSKDILQGIYLDDTSVAVSNDAVVQSLGLYDDTFTGVYNNSFANNLGQIFSNIYNLNNNKVGARVTPSSYFKLLTYIYYQGWRSVRNKLFFQPYENINNYNKYDTSILSNVNINIQRSNDILPVLQNNNYFFNTYDLEQHVSFKPNAKYVPYVTTLKNRISTSVKPLIDLYNHSSTNKYEKKYIDSMFNDYFGLDWKLKTQSSLVSNWFNSKAYKNDAMYFVISINNESFIQPNQELFTNDQLLEKYKFILEDQFGVNYIERNLSITLYDFILPRINDKKTTGLAVGCLILRIDGQTKVSLWNNNSEGEASYSVSKTAMNSISKTNKIKLRKLQTSNAAITSAQKYNYSNILAEQRLGNEYQSRFKFFNTILIDRIYNADLIGPFIMEGDVQRIVETPATALTKNYRVNINPNNVSSISTSIEGSQDGTSTSPRAAGAAKNFSDWNISQSAFNEDSLSIKHIIDNPNVSQAFITININSLADTLSKSQKMTLKADGTAEVLDAGSKFPAIVNIAVELGTINISGVEVTGETRKFKIVSLIESPTIIDIGNPEGTFAIDDYKFISQYGSTDQKSIFAPFQLAQVENTISALDSPTKRYIKISKLSTETNSTLISKDISLAKITEIMPVNLTYPFSAVIATKLDSRSFSNIPTRTYDCKLKKIKVPSNYMPSSQNGKDKRYIASIADFNSVNQEDKLIYDGDWDGTFNEELVWTDNPAWILYDLLTSKRYGLGQYIDESQIDVFDLYKIARFCDAVDDFGYFQGVPDGAGGLEPRFSCNILFSEGIKIFDALNTIAALFRGIIYYNNSQINFVDDRIKDPIALFSNSNVKDGIFDYTNYRRDEQFNTIEVVYIDRFENFLTKVEFIEDEEDIRKRGVFKKTINANGVTSRAMARRLGQHLIFQTIKENQSVSFSTGLESLLCRPGDLIIIEDELKSLQSNFGKVLSINSQTNSIRLNEKFNSGQFNNKITVYTPTGISSFDETFDIAKRNRSRINDSGFYITSGGWSPSYNYITGFYQFSKYSDGFNQEKIIDNGSLKEQYAFYTGSGSKFCFYSTEFTGWILGTGLAFTNKNIYNKFIFDIAAHDFTELNRGFSYFYDSGISSGRYGMFPTALNNQVSGSGSKFRDIDSLELEMTNGLIPSDISLSNPSQITTFSISGIVQYDYGCEVFINSGDINYSLVPFIKEGSIYRFQRKAADDQIYKVISIKEANPNEYTMICTKFNTGKYSLIENEQSIQNQANTYSYSLSQKIGNTNYTVLNTPIISSLVTGTNLVNNTFYISGNWKIVSNAKGYNIKLYQPNGVIQEATVSDSVSGYGFYINGIGNYSYRVCASGNYSAGANVANETNRYYNSDYNSSGLFLIYEESIVNYDRPFLSSVTIL